MSDESFIVKRKNYYREAYAKYWLKARAETYNVMDYDLRFIELIDKKLKRNTECLLLDVGIGTGFPIASSLASLNYDMSGIDISSLLIKKCLEDYPNIHAEVGDAENMHFAADTFHLVYCCHSSWLFHDFFKALTSMFSVTKKNGIVLFDIMNKNNPDINKIYKQHVFENTHFVGKLFKTFKNIVKFILQAGTQDWPYLVSWSPSDPNKIIHKCLSFDAEVQLYAWQDETLIELPVSDNDTYRDHGRLVLSCKV